MPSRRKPCHLLPFFFFLPPPPPPAFALPFFPCPPLGVPDRSLPTACAWPREAAAPIIGSSSSTAAGVSAPGEVARIGARIRARDFDIWDSSRRLRVSNRFRMIEENVLYLIHYINHQRLVISEKRNRTYCRVVRQLQHQMTSFRREFDAIADLLPIMSVIAEMHTPMRNTPSLASLHRDPLRPAMIVSFDCRSLKSPADRLKRRPIFDVHHSGELILRGPTLLSSCLPLSTKNASLAGVARADSIIAADEMSCDQKIDKVSKMFRTFCHIIVYRVSGGRRDGSRLLSLSADSSLLNIRVGHRMGEP